MDSLPSREVNSLGTITVQTFHTKLLPFVLHFFMFLFPRHVLKTVSEIEDSLP